MPAANAGNDAGICDGESTTINSVVGNGNIVWTPGNYNTASITITPTATTTYTLVVSDAIGCTGSDTVTVVVYPIPVAQIINPNPTCGNNSILFQDASTVATGSITSWLWDFGNGQTSTSQNPSANYDNAGSFPITLSIVTDGGCTDTETSTQIIWANPSASFTHTNACEGIAIDFTNASTISDASALSYMWNLGDNTTTGSVDVTHQYSSYGTYSASLLVSSVNGCVDSITSLVNVYSLPQAAIVLDYACEDATASMTDGSTIPQGIINSWYWTLGDGSTSILPNPSNIYTDAGNYPVHLLVTSEHGCADSTDAIMRIAPRPVVDFQTENDCLGFPVDFTDMSNALTGPIVSYSWRFGDGNTSDQQNPQHLYYSSGWFEVSLTATTDSGCSSTLERSNALQIYQPPYANFSSNASVADDIYPLVNFYNQTGVSGQYFWNFGDGDTSTVYSPTHLYAEIGKYDVQLIAIDQKGCIDSTIIRIEIKPSSNVYIPNAFTPNGDSENDLFQVYSYNVKSMAVQIYDRWGIKIKEWQDVSGAWDGKVDGNPAQNDTYVYRVETVDVNDIKEVRVGHVSLIR
jgi:gliding motility-associated-like protein